MTVKNKTQKIKYTREQMQHCKKDFCKLFSNKMHNFMQLGQTKRGLKKIKITNTMKKQSMKSCQKTYCNNGCKGSTLEAGKKLPKIDKSIQIIIDKKQAEEFRKKLFKKRTDILEDNVPYNMPLKIKKQFLEKGALSICLPYIKDGGLEYISKNIWK